MHTSTHRVLTLVLTEEFFALALTELCTLVLRGVRTLVLTQYSYLYSYFTHIALQLYSQRSSLHLHSQNYAH